MNWIDQIANSIPDHSAHVANTLREVMTTVTLPEIDAHACALAAALATSNGPLAFEISMNGPLFGRPERDTIAGVVSSAALTQTSDRYLEFFDQHLWIETNTNVPDQQFVTSISTWLAANKFVFSTDKMSAICQAVVGISGNSSAKQVKRQLEHLCKYHKMHPIECLDIIKIASVIGAVGKVMS